MEGKLSVYSRNKLLSHIFKEKYDSNNEVYISLCDIPQNENKILNLNNNSKRKKINFYPALNGSIHQKHELEFKVKNNKNNINGFLIHDSIENGNILAFGKFITKIKQNENKTIIIPKKEITICIKNIDVNCGLSKNMINNLLNMMFNGFNYESQKDNIYIGISTTKIKEEHSIYSDFIEQEKINNYQRLNIPSEYFNNPKNGIIKNNKKITFNIPSGQWSTIYSFVTVDSIVGGNIINYSNCNVINLSPCINDIIEIDKNDYEIEIK